MPEPNPRPYPLVAVAFPYRFHDGFNLVGAINYSKTAPRPNRIDKGLHIILPDGAPQDHRRDHMPLHGIIEVTILGTVRIGADHRRWQNALWPFKQLWVESLLWRIVESILAGCKESPVAWYIGRVRLRPAAVVWLSRLYSPDVKTEPVRICAVNKLPATCRLHDVSISVAILHQSYPRQVSRVAGTVPDAVPDNILLFDRI